MKEPFDDVSNIHKRYSLTLINPSSYTHSLILSVIVMALLVATTVFGYLKTDDFVIRILFVIPILLATQYLDSKFIKNKEYSKSLHSSLFGNILWLIIALAGLLSVSVLSKDDVSLFYVAEGMFLFAGFRVGIFTTTLGVSLKKSLVLCFVQPLAIFLALIPSNMIIPTLLDPITLVVGFTFIVVASVWSTLTDKSGRPGVKSTHKLVQAYLASKSQNNPNEMELLMEEFSKKSKISTSQIRFHSDDTKNDFRLVLPEIHPGPFHPVGGSNIPYLIYKNFDSSAMVMHSISDHSLNLPSKKQVDEYLESLGHYKISKNGIKCAEPVIVQINKSRSVGLLFDKTAVLLLSLSPYGMEDIPPYIKNEIEQFAKNRNFDQVLIVDCHNAMGPEITKTDSDDMLNAAKSCLDTLMTKETFPFKFGYVNSDDLKISASDLASGGIGVLCLEINNKKYFLGWADANNMENGTREHVVNYLAKNGYDLLEICTSDTHYTVTPARNKNGYFQFGIVSKPQQIADWYLGLAQKAEKNLVNGRYEMLENAAEVKVMGSTIFQDYSKAMDKSLKITKIFLTGIVAFFVLTLFL